MLGLAHDTTQQAALWVTPRRGQYSETGGVMVDDLPRRRRKAGAAQRADHRRAGRARGALPGGHQDRAGARGTDPGGAR